MGSVEDCVETVVEVVESVEDCVEAVVDSVVDPSVIDVGGFLGELDVVDDVVVINSLDTGT